MGEEQIPGNAAGFDRRAQEDVVDVVVGRVVVREERDADPVQARLDGQRGGGHARARRAPHLLVPVEQLHLLAVDRHRQPFALDLAERVVRLPHVAFEDRDDPELVLAVGRKFMLDEHAAPCAERQPFDVVVLRGIVGDIELDEGGRRIRRHRQAADLARRRQIRFHQRRRHGQRAGDVVEPVGRIVRGQESRGIDLQPDEIANDVLVLGPVETVNPGCGQVGDGVAVQVVFHPRDEPVEGGPIGPRRPRGRHHPDAQLQRDLLGNRRVVRQPGQVELIEGQPAGLQARVVAPHAILVEHRARRGGVRRVPCCGSLAGDGRHCQERQKAADEHPLEHAPPFATAYGHAADLRTPSSGGSTYLFACAT